MVLDIIKDMKQWIIQHTQKHYQLSNEKNTLY